MHWEIDVRRHARPIDERQVYYVVEVTAIEDSIRNGRGSSSVLLQMGRQALESLRDQIVEAIREDER